MSPRPCLRLALVLSLGAGFASAQTPIAERAAPSYVPGELLIGFAPGAAQGERLAARAELGADLASVLTTAAMRQSAAGELELLRLPAGLSVEAAIAAVADQPGVRFAEPNWIYTHGAASNDTLFTNGSLWGMYGDQSSPANAFGSQAAEAWAAGNVGSSSVYVAVIDEGVQNTHQDLAANIWNNPFDPVDGLDNDGNGYKDDRFGWDFAGNNNTTYDGTQDDHGTHVAGTIGGVGGNAKGVAGVCWNVRIISCKFLGNTGGTTANAVRAIDYVTDLKNRHGLNIVATNNSWGGGGFSQSLSDAIGRANTAGILFIAAAGNNGSNNDQFPNYPASYTHANIISVASITNTGARSSFSNFGATSVDIGAPGSSIQSTMPSSNGSKYGLMSGTSMAAPHVTGAAALYAASHPGASLSQIRSAILGNAVPTASLSGRCTTGGRLNASSF